MCPARLDDLTARWEEQHGGASAALSVRLAQPTQVVKLVQLLAQCWAHGHSSSLGNVSSGSCLCAALSKVFSTSISSQVM